MNLAIVSVSILFASTAFGSSAVEESIFNNLKRNGALVEYTYSTIDVTGEIKLNTLDCRFGSIYSCSLVETARPLETTILDESDSEEIFQLLKSTGIKTVKVFGQEFLNVQVLRCKNKKLKDGQRSTYSCKRLGPLISPHSNLDD